jgi:hypothetical protein
MQQKSALKTNEGCREDASERYYASVRSCEMSHLNIFSLVF